jgi:GMP synthase-like glutamine amidotransferase
MKIVGICFGMQVIAMALGGPQAVVPNEKGWEIGVYEVGLTDAGRDWFGRVTAVDGRLEDAEDGESMSERVVEKVVGTEKIVSRSLAFESSDARWVGEEPLG